LCHGGWGRGDRGTGGRGVRGHVGMKPALVTPCLLLIHHVYVCAALFAWGRACVRFGLVENAKQKYKK